MLRKAADFKKFQLRALDGNIGKAREFYFDDRDWTVRYLVADNGGWLTGLQVLISPYALKPANEEEAVLPVNLTKKQIEKSPSLNTDEPVSRQYELNYYSYYGWPMYWGGPYMWGPVVYPAMQSDELAKPDYGHSGHGDGDDPHLRSTQAVSGYHIQALDGEIGHVIDFIIDEKTWTIRYLIIDTTNWWGGKRLLVSPEWIERISWEESKVFINLSCDSIKSSPEYIPESLSREYETKLHQHYSRQGYWDDQAVASNQSKERHGLY